MTPRLSRDLRGVTIVEFAIVAPILLMFIFGIIESARMLWTAQALQETAYATARCVAIDDTRCGTEALARQFAVDRAGQSRIALPSSAVSFDFNATCNGVPGMDRVALSMPYGSPIGGLVPAFPDKLEAAACMPPSSSEE